MESSDSKMTETFEKARDWLLEQEWFQQLKAKWDELDPQSRMYLKVGGGAGSVLLVVLILFSAMWNVHALKRDYHDKLELLALIDSANIELNSLREVLPPEHTGPGGADEKVDWKSFINAAITGASLDPSAADISPEKPGLPLDAAKESMYDVSLKHVTIRQIVRFAFMLESGGRPFKVRNLKIDTKADPTGYMDAQLAVSGFTVASSGGGGK
jgi:hypothetical protein